MSTQITVRLPDEMVDFLDRTVATGKAPSRAAIVASAVGQEMRRLAAEQDAQILQAQGAADDLDDLVQWTSTTRWSRTERVREICHVRLDRTRPALVLTREAARAAMTKVTVAPITSTIEGLSSEFKVGPDNGLDNDCVVSLDNVLTVAIETLGRTVGYLSAEQEAQLARAVVMAYDLEVSLLDS